MNLNQFVKSQNRNCWISEPKLQAYVRRSTRVFQGNIIKCLDIASVEVQEHYRSKKVFTKFLRKFERIAKRENLCVFIESILEIRLKSFLTSKGYTVTIENNAYKLL